MYISLEQTSFQCQLADIQSSELEYAHNHFLGIPPEVRDEITEQAQLNPKTPVTGARPEAGCENLQLVNRQLFHETENRWHVQATVMVPSNRLEEFISRILNVTTLQSNAYKSVKSLYLEIPHDASSSVFSILAEVLEHSTNLEELHLFGVGPDRYGVKTSSVAHVCGKHDTSLIRPRKLHTDGQEYQKRLAIFNSIVWLKNLKTLVLDNLNMPLLQAHVLHNKPKLTKLFIAADPRSMLHNGYFQRKDLRRALGSFAYTVHDAFPPVKELRIDSNSILTASQVASKVAETLESLDWVIPDVAYQKHADRISFFSEAEILLRDLDGKAKQLKELRLCVHGAIYEEHYHYGNFMGAMKDCLPRMKTLQLLEVHIHSKSPWFASELIDVLPPSITRLYLSDLLVDRDLKALVISLCQKTQTPWEPFDDDTDIAVGEDLSRKDYIHFSHNKLAFVGYEYDLFLEKNAAKKQKDDMAMFLELNGRLLDKERNRHLADLNGKHIPPKEMSAETLVEDIELMMDQLLVEDDEEEIASKRGEFAECVFGDDNEYFGNENAAEAVFLREPVAAGRDYTFPTILEVDSECKFSNHWLSK